MGFGVKELHFQWVRSGWRMEMSLRHHVSQTPSFVLINRFFINLMKLVEFLWDKDLGNGQESRSTVFVGSVAKIV